MRKNINRKFLLAAAMLFVLFTNTFPQTGLLPTLPSLLKKGTRSKANFGKLPLLTVK